MESALSALRPARVTHRAASFAVAWGESFGVDVARGAQATTSGSCGARAERVSAPRHHESALG